MLPIKYDPKSRNVRVDAPIDDHRTLGLASAILAILAVLAYRRNRRR